MSQDTPFQARPLRLCRLWHKLGQCAALLNILWMEMALYKFLLLLLLLIIVITGELGYDGPLYNRFLHMTDDMLGPSPMHIKYSSYVYDGFCIWRTNFLGPIGSVISKFTCTIITLFCWDICVLISVANKDWSPHHSVYPERRAEQGMPHRGLQAQVLPRHCWTHQDSAVGRFYGK